MEEVYAENGFVRGEERTYTAKGVEERRDLMETPYLV